MRRLFSRSPYLGYLQASSRVPFLQVVKTGVAAVAAWAVCIALLPQTVPAFGVIAALLVVQPSVNQSFSKAIERSVGVVIGVLVAYFAVLAFGATTWLMVLSVLVSLLLGWVLRLSAMSAVQIPISAMLVIALGGSNPAYALDRVLETVIGAVIGVVINLAIVPPVLLAPAEEAVGVLGDHVAAALDAAATMLTAPTTAGARTGALVEARLLRPMQAKAEEALASAEESLRFNPRRGTRREDLQRDQAVLTMLTVLVTRVLGMTRAIVDRYDDGVLDEPVARSIADQLTDAAHDLRVVLERTDLTTEDSAPLTTQTPALTSPLTVLRPDSEHWILLGSLLEDLRRVREEVIDLRAAALPPR